MVRSLTLAFCGVCFTAAAHGDLQLTPQAAVYKGDGATFNQLEFFDNGKIVTYRSPRGWAFSGNATQLTLRPPNKLQAEATVTRVPLSEPGNFDDESLEDLVCEAVALVHTGSENISVVSRKESANDRAKGNFPDHSHLCFTAKNSPLDSLS